MVKTVAETKNARTRLIAIIEALTMFSDETRPISLDDLCIKLNECGYDVSKRTLLADIKLLNTTSVKIDYIPQKGYFMHKAYSQDTIDAIIYSAYSSEIVNLEKLRNVETYLRKSTCIDTFDFTKETIEKITSVSPHEFCSKELLFKLKQGIFEKKKMNLTILYATPGDSFSCAETEKVLRVNPLKIGVISDSLMFVFSVEGDAQNAKCMHVCRIKDAEILDESIEEYNGKIKDAKGYFTGLAIDHRNREPDWFLVKFKSEDLELVRNYFSNPLQFRKADEEGYVIAKINAVFNERIVGWLFHFGDKLELIGPKALKDYFDENLKKKFAQYH